MSLTSPAAVRTGDGAAGAPSPEDRRRRVAAFAAARRVLAPQLSAGGVLRCSPLGPEWSTDVDAHLPERPGDEVLEAAGWLPLAGLLQRIGRGAPDRWAVLGVGGEVLGAVDLTLEPAPSPVESVLRRARRRGEVRAREALELRRLAEEGVLLPADPVVAAAASIDGWRPDAPGGAGVLATVALARSRRARVRSVLARASRPLRRRRLAIGLSGVDGAGKSTLAHELSGALSRAGVPATVVWSRPGMGLGPLERLARRAAAGERAAVRSRRGALGWTWGLVVVSAHLVDVWRQHLAADGVVIHDRHAIDAHVTLDVLYADHGLRLQHRLIDVMLPRVACSVHVDVPPEVAVSRKPGDVIGELAVREQLDAYRRRLAPDALRLDGTRPVSENVERVLRSLVGAAEVR